MPVDIDLDAYARAIADAVARQFAAGLSIAYEDEGFEFRTIREYPDGHREFVRWDDSLAEIVVDGPAPGRR